MRFEKKIKKYPTDDIEVVILTIIKTELFKDTKRLVTFLIDQYGFSEDSINDALTKLENEKKICFKHNDFKSSPTANSSFHFTIFLWYWVIIVMSIVTSIIVFFVPNNVYPVIYVRYFLGFAFTLFLPGFVLLKVFFPTTFPIKTNSIYLNILMQLFFSLALSLVLTPMIGIMLNYLPWGVGFVPVTLILLLLVVFFATVSVLRDYTRKSRS